MCELPGWHALAGTEVHVDRAAYRLEGVMEISQDCRWKCRTTHVWCERVTCGVWETLEVEADVKEDKRVDPSVTSPSLIVTVYHTEREREPNESELGSEMAPGAIDGHWVVTWSINQEAEAEKQAGLPACDESLQLQNGAKIKFEIFHICCDDEAECIQAAICEGRDEAFNAPNRCDIDIGCGKDLIGLRLATQVQEYIKYVPEFKFNAANNQVSVSGTLPITVGDSVFGSHDGEAAPCVIKSSPAVLSVGMRCKKYGMSFIWLSGKNQCAVTSGKRIFLM